MGRGMVRGCVVVGVAVAVLGALPGMAAAKGKHLTARIGGKGFRAMPRTVIASSPGTDAFGLTGTRPSIRSTRQLDIQCEVPGLRAGLTFPVTVTCAAEYLATGGLTVKGWTTANGISFTITSFDGTRLVGTFEGQIESPGSTNPTDPPLAVQKGKVAVDIIG
jgi:hypothetical protein